MNIIVIGSLNTDIVASGINTFPKPGEHVYAQKLQIGPGGKSRNIADMIARLTPPKSVAMIGRTVRDHYGLWKAPIEALETQGVDTSHVIIEDGLHNDKLPGIALIPVDKNGANQIIVIPGVSNDFSPEDIEKASHLFKTAGQHNGTLVLTMECPLDTILCAAKLAHEHGLKICFDPGGIQKDTDIERLFKLGVFLIKPNEHETAILTGIEPKDFASAQDAAEILRKRGAENVIITVGKDGAYLFTPEIATHIAIPTVETRDERDETGCGDQTIAALVASLEQGMPIDTAARQAIRAGTLQYYRAGIQPITASELAK